MNDIVAFLRARLGEDEEVTRAAEGDRWYVNDAVDDGDGVAVVKDDPYSRYSIVYWPHNDAEQRVTYDHIARWDPARVLAEVQVKRAVLDAFVDEDGQPHHLRTAMSEARRFAYLFMLRAIAAVYRGHPDYDQAWKPESYREL